MNTVQRSYDILSKFSPCSKFCLNKSYSIIDLRLAHEELIRSLSNTLELGEGNNPLAKSARVYDKLIDCNGNNIPGIKLHREQDVLHITNVFRLNKVVHVPGVYSSPISNRKTIAKNDLRKITPLKNWGQFSLGIGRFSKLVVNKLTVKELDCIRDI